MVIIGQLACIHDHQGLVSASGLKGFSAGAIVGDGVGDPGDICSMGGEGDDGGEGSGSGWLVDPEARGRCCSGRDQAGLVGLASGAPPSVLAVTSNSKG
jgi:hypothetical protein